MKIIISDMQVLFNKQEKDTSVFTLAEQLEHLGHQTDILRIPFSASPDRILQQILALRRYHLENACDRLICVGGPSYLLKHSVKYIWLPAKSGNCLNQLCSDMIVRYSKNDAFFEYTIRAERIAFLEASALVTSDMETSNYLKQMFHIRSESASNIVANFLSRKTRGETTSRSESHSAMYAALAWRFTQ